MPASNSHDMLTPRSRDVQGTPFYLPMTKLRVTLHLTHSLHDPSLPTMYASCSALASPLAIFDCPWYRSGSAGGCTLLVGGLLHKLGKRNKLSSYYKRKKRHSTTMSTNNNTLWMRSSLRSSGVRVLNLTPFDSTRTQA